MSPSATTNDLTTALATITRGLPSGAVASSQTYLARKASVDRTASLFVPILLAFSVFALLAAAFIIANVVTGIVLSSYREIGVMKAIGFTPGQVTWTLLVQILVPVALGAVIGVAIGSVLSQPVVADTARSFGLPTAFSLSVPVVATVLIAAFATAIVAAIGPAVRAGRLSAVRAITRGTTPSSRPDGGRLRRTALDLPLAAPVRIGLAASVAHPLRAAMTLGALTVGVSALVFALGLDGSLVRVAGQLERDQPSPIRVVTFEGAGKAGGPQLVGPGDDPQAVTPPTAQAVDAAIAATPGTGRSVAIGQTVVTVPGLGGAIPFVGYRGDASWIGYELIRGRWFARPGEAVAPTNLFATAGLHLGDAVTMTVDGRAMTVTLVGEIFDQAPENENDLVLRGTYRGPGRARPRGRAVALGGATGRRRRPPGLRGGAERGDRPGSIRRRRQRFALRPGLPALRERDLEPRAGADRDLARRRVQHRPARDAPAGPRDRGAQDDRHDPPAGRRDGHRLDRADRGHGRASSASRSGWHFSGSSSG